MSVRVDMSNAQFENENELRKYPFSDSSSLVDRNGKLLPEDLISDAHMVVSMPSVFGPRGFSEVQLPEVKLVSAHLSPSMVSVCFMANMSGRSDAASVSVSASRFVPYMPYRLEPLYGSGGIGGMVTFGNLSFPNFANTYFLDEAKINPCCVSVARRNALRCFVDPRNGERLSGDVEVEFSDHVSARRSGNSFSLTLNEGSDAALVSECANGSGIDACGATPISSINGIRPDDDGNIVIWFH